TVAVSVTVPPPGGAVTTIVIGGAAPGASVAAVQVTTWPATVQLQPVAFAAPSTAPAGHVAVTLTAAASLGPRLLAAVVLVRGAPAVAGSGASVALMARSALAVTVVEVDALLLAGVGSAVAASTVTVSVIVPAAAGAVAVIAIGAEAPAASAARVQVTTWPAAAHVQPAPTALTNVTPAGRVSVAVSDAASLGP